MTAGRQTDTHTSCVHTQHSTFDLPIAGYGCLYMGIEAVAFFLLTLLLEYLIRRPALAKLLGGAPLSAAPEAGAVKDEDVQREEGKLVHASMCLRRRRLPPVVCPLVAWLDADPPFFAHTFHSTQSAWRRGWRTRTRCCSGR